MADYDTTEATIILKRLVNVRNLDAKQEATTKLLAALKALLASDGDNFRIETDERRAPDEHFVFRGNAEVCRFYVRDGAILYVRAAGKSPAAYPLKLSFDGASGLWVGEDEDMTKHPVPGAVRERRSALAVIVAEIDSIYRELHPER